MPKTVLYLMAALVIVLVQQMHPSFIKQIKRWRLLLCVHVPIMLSVLKAASTNNKGIGIDTIFVL